ncbi:MAG TPA: NAD(P)-dependent oxidoreductase [Burkholderiales bacterium]|nr:NAD(P)-dependent oxidoreductase [Burkholderiales bacterium]
MKIGFIGLGLMGRAMARHLIRGGHEVTVYNRTAGPAQELAKAGATVAQNAEEACRGEVILTMLADDTALREVMIDSGIIARLPKNIVHVCMATISVPMARELTSLHTAHGSAYVSAPCFGRPEAAVAGKLAIVAAGPSWAVARVRPLFDLMGPKVFIFGEEAALANVAKISANFYIASTIETLGEAFALVRKHGIAPDAYFDFISSTFECYLNRSYGSIIAQEKYSPAGFRLQLGLKDVTLALATAEEVNVALPTASLIRDQMLSAMAKNYGDLDWAVIAAVTAENAGLPTSAQRRAGLDR